MFKRLLSVFSFNGGGKSASVTRAPTPAQSQPAIGEPITAYDAYGRELKITRTEWRDKVFLPTIEKNWNDADALYKLIVSGLNDGFRADLEHAAKRLLEIDSDPERSHIILGILLMEDGQLDAAEATFRAGITKAGSTGTLLTNLAKVFSHRGDKTRADETLWQAVQADPNQENGLVWWLSIQKEREGEAGYLQGLHTAVALPTSWRAKLWLARHHLQHKEVEAARLLYGDVLSGGLYDGSSLVMISGDLGHNGYTPLILEVVGPVFDEHKHDPMTGLNLLRACQELGDLEKGMALLDRMYALGLIGIKHHLDQFSQAFQEMQKQTEQTTPRDMSAVKFVTLSLTKPIWQYGLRDADWLFSQKSEGTAEIGFFPLSKIADSTDREESQREDDLGRLTRASPLYFAEAVHYWTDYAARSYIPVVEGDGPIVSVGKTDGEALFDIVPQTTKYFVTGEIGCKGEGDDSQWQICINLWDCSTRTKKLSESGIATKAELGALMLKIEHRLLANIGSQRQQPLDSFYLHPTVEVMPVYLTELGQAFMMTLLANNYLPKTAVWGERAMLDWPLTLVLKWPTVEIPKIMYISGLGKALDYQSDVLPEYKDRSMLLLREANQANSPVARLAPLIWKIFGMKDEFYTHMDKHADEDPAYKAWLKRVDE